MLKKRVKKSEREQKRPHEGKRAVEEGTFEVKGFEIVFER